MKKEIQAKPFISVVVTAFNEEEYLPRCLEALNNQTYRQNKFQGMVVDNNSTDKTAQITTEFGARVILEKRQGYVFALKRGMNEANGDIIAVTDADTQVANDWLWTIAKVFANPDVVAVTGLVCMNAKSKIIGKFMDISYAVLMRVGAFIGKPNLTGFNFAVRKDTYSKVGGLNTMFKMSPDVDLGMRLAKLGKVKVANNLLVYTSARRWEKGFFSTLFEYLNGHICAAWLRKPPPVKQTVIR